MASKSVTQGFNACASNNEVYPLLDSRWIAECGFPIFRVPICKSPSCSDCIQWQKDMSILISYYSNLLTCPFDQFWGEIKHKKSLHVSINSFLELCPRDIKSVAIPERLLDIIGQMYALVLLVILRASKATESENYSLQPFEHENIICDVFDVPRLMDLAILYGSVFCDIVSDIFRFVFRPNSRFVRDAVSAVQCALTALNRVEIVVSKWQFSDRHQFVSFNADSVDVVSNTIDYITDAGRSLGVFLTFAGPINSSIAEHCIRLNSISSLAYFYNTVIVTVRDHILRSMTWSAVVKSTLLRKLAIAAAAHVRTVRAGLVEPGLINKIMHLAFNGSDVNSHQALQEVAGSLISVMTDVLNFTEFATAYALLYSVDNDITLIREVTNSDSIDGYQLDYLQNAFSCLIAESSSYRGSIDNAKDVVPPPVGKMLLSSPDNQPQAGCSSSPQFISVKAVLPSTDDDLIERCLVHYNNDFQAVITALLDESVPLSVSCPERVKTPVQYKRNHLWQGKRQNDAKMQPLSREEREFVSYLASTVGDDDDDVNSTDADAAEAEMNSLAKPQVDLTYDDEYDDTYDTRTMAKSEPVNEEEVENLGTDQRSDQRQHRNVLQIENPEDFRLRRQRAAANRAAQRGHGGVMRHKGTLPQPELGMNLSSRSFVKKLNSNPDHVTQAIAGIDLSTPSTRSSITSDSHRDNRSNRRGGRHNLNSGAYSRRQKGRFGDHNQRSLAGRKRNLQP